MLVRLWRRWIDLTRERAESKAKFDQLMFGNGYMARYWWGWKHLPCDAVVILRRKHA